MQRRKLKQKLVVVLLGLSFLAGTFGNLISNLRSRENIVGCYGATLGQDRYTLNITAQSGDRVMAQIVFANAQKDSSFGTFVGKYDGKVLLGMYTFQSEGSVSNRQLIFKRTSNGFYQGYGDVRVVGDTESLVNPAMVSWDTTYKFEIGKCVKGGIVNG